MSQNSAISIAFKLEGDTGGFKKLSIDAEGFRKVIKAVVAEAEQLKSSAFNFAAIATGIDSVNKTFTDLQTTLKGLSDVYSAQIEAETKLAVNMRNTMGAREADIQSIKDLCAAQQALGVIGDEVQLAGAQELATYLSEKQSLEQLIPVMNDMLAQQYGLNATQESAAQIATMLGKVMDGQTGALSRYGYSFDAVQEQILKFGTESQRAAVLCDVVSGSVGGMNAELAKTDVGKQKQLENTLGDIQEKLGGAMQWALPFVTMAANATLAITGMAKLAMGVKSVVMAVTGLNVAQAAMKGLLIAGTGSTTKATQALNIYSASAKGSAAASTVLGIALRGLLVASGVGLAIMAVTSVIGYFINKTDEATDSTNKFLNAEERAKRDAEQLEQLRQQEATTLSNSRALLELNINKLKEFNGSKEQEKKVVEEMNNTYGDTMGYFSSVSDWYKALTANSEAYCKQMVTEARTRILANQIAEKEQENHDIIYNDDGSKKTYSKKRDPKLKKASPNSYNVTRGSGYETEEEGIIGSSELEKAQAAYNANVQAIANLNKRLNNAVKESAGINYEVKGAETRPTGTTPEKTSTTALPTEVDNKAETLKGITENIRILTEKLQGATKESASEINKEIDLWKQKEDAIRNAGKEAKNNSVQWHENATTLAEITDNLKFLDEELQTATIERAAEINQQKLALEGQAAAIKNAGIPSGGEKSEPKYDAGASTLRGIADNIAYLNDQLQDAGLQEAEILNRQISAWEEKADAIRNAGKEALSTFGAFREGWGSVKDIGSGVESITSALEGNANAWQTVTGIIDGFLQIFDSIKAIIGIIDMLSFASNAHATAKIAEGAAIGVATGAQAAEAISAETAAVAQLPVIAANKLATASYMELAAAAYFAAHAYIPFAGFGIASGFVAAATGIVEGIGLMPFANGGIVSGPTVGLIGEYAGASNNPEVVAPLDKLRDILNPAGTPVIVGGTLRASGRDIVCVLANETRTSSKSGRRTNIKL